MKIVNNRLLSLVLFVLITAATVFPPAVSARTSACVPGAESHEVRGRGSVVTGNFRVRAQETPDGERGVVFYENTSIPNKKVQARLTCVDYDGVSSFHFTGEAEVWYDGVWETGYDLSGFVTDDPVWGDSFYIFWCKGFLCETFADNDLVSGDIEIR